MRAKIVIGKSKIRNNSGFFPIAIACRLRAFLPALFFRAWARGQGSAALFGFFQSSFLRRLAFFCFCHIGLFHTVKMGACGRLAKMV